ncbi:MAG: hypothetical protein WBO48_01475, partial [Candidatus Promineifilaceae bacterium]
LTQVEHFCGDIHLKMSLNADSRMPSAAPIRVTAVPFCLDAPGLVVFTTTRSDEQHIWAGYEKRVNIVTGKHVIYDVYGTMTL